MKNLRTSPKNRIDVHVRFRPESVADGRLQRQTASMTSHSGDDDIAINQMPGSVEMKT